MVERSIKMAKQKCVYIVEGWEDREFDDDSSACDFIGEIEDFYTDEGLQMMCEEMIYEVCTDDAN
jgi:hypothetical protein